MRCSVLQAPLCRYLTIAGSRLSLADGMALGAARCGADGWPNRGWSPRPGHSLAVIHIRIRG